VGKQLLHVLRAIKIGEIQCSLDLPFFKGVEKTIDECGETRNPENHFFNKKVVHCLLLLGRILPQLKI
jgi:hypothetical protein